MGVRAALEQRLHHALLGIHEEGQLVEGALDVRRVLKVVYLFWYRTKGGVRGKEAVVGIRIKGVLFDTRQNKVYRASRRWCGGQDWRDALEGYSTGNRVCPASMKKKCPGRESICPTMCGTFFESVNGGSINGIRGRASTVPKGRRHGRDQNTTKTCTLRKTSGCKEETSLLQTHPAAQGFEPARGANVDRGVTLRRRQGEKSPSCRTNSTQRLANTHLRNGIIARAEARKDKNISADQTPKRCNDPVCELHARCRLLAPKCQSKPSQHNTRSGPSLSCPTTCGTARDRCSSGAITPLQTEKLQTQSDRS